MKVAVRNTLIILSVLFFGILCQAQQDSAIEKLIISLGNISDYDKKNDRIMFVKDSLRKENKRKEWFYFLKNASEYLYKSQDFMASAYANIQLGNFYNNVGKYDKAISSFNHARSIIENPNNKYAGTDNAINLLHLVYLNSGNSYYFLENYDKTLINYKKSLEELKKKKVQDSSNDKRLASIFNNLGIAYNFNSNKSSSEFYFNQALKLHVKLKDSIGIANMLCNLAQIQEAKNNLDSAQKLFFNAKNIYEKLGDLSDKVFIYNNISASYIKMKKPEDALKYAKRALEISNTDETGSNLIVTYHCLYNIYAFKKDLQNEYKFFKLYKAAVDSADSEVSVNEINTKQMQLEFSQLHITDSIISANTIKNRDLKIQQTKQQKYYLLIILAVVILGLWQVYNRYRTSQKQKAIIQGQKHLVDEKNREIIESINYAKRLQDAILPTGEKLRSVISEHFVLYKPKDIVAGDFYWLHVINPDKNNAQLLIAAADCTGHGVPGAMMSIACNNALNRTIDELKVKSTGEILDATREMIIENFNKNNSSIRDGMDISLLAINNKTKTIEWSGANNRLLYVSDNNLTELKADKQPIGNYEKKTPFKTNNLSFKKGDVFYLFTDGFVDQFGGPQNKKFGIANFKALINENKTKSLSEQLIIFENTFSEWKKATEQIDDVTVLAIKI